MYLHPTPALRHFRIPLGTWSEDTLLFCFTAQAWNAFRTELLRCFVLTGTTHFPASLQVSSFTREANRAIFAIFFNCCCFFVREKWNEYSFIHKCKMIHCRFVHCNYVQKPEARVLVIQVVDAKAHYLLHGSLRYETTSKARQSCHQSNVCATMYV